MGTGDLSDVERPRLGEDIYKHPHRPQLVVMDPQDGLPRVTTTMSMEDSKAPPLDPETLVCMGDESVFVIRDVWGEIMVRVDGSQARRLFMDDGMAQWVAPLTEEQRAQALTPPSLMGGSCHWYAVEPLRPQCAHYRRVMTDFEQTEFKAVERVCTAQKDESGQFQALRDQRVYACEHRHPRDFVSEERLRKFDADSMAQAKQADEEWDGDAALAAAVESSGKTP